VKFSDLPNIPNDPDIIIFHLNQNQYFPSVAVVFDANIITVHSCVHL